MINYEKIIVPELMRELYEKVKEFEHKCELYAKNFSD